MEKLSLLPAGTPHRRATEMLASEAMAELVEQMATRYPDRILVFDSPPLLVTTEARVLASHMGQIVMVVEADVTTQAAVKQALETIESCPVVLMVLNKAPRTEVGGYYGYGGYGGYGADDAEPESEFRAGAQLRSRVVGRASATRAAPARRRDRALRRDWLRGRSRAGARGELEDCRRPRRATETYTSNVNYSPREAWPKATSSTSLSGALNINGEGGAAQAQRFDRRDGAVLRRARHRTTASRPTSI